MYQKLVNHVRATYKSSSIRYHRAHRLRAEGFLKNIENERGCLEEGKKARCNEYAHDVLGDGKFAPWLYVYTAMSGDFKEGWIPDNYYGRVVLPRVKGRYGAVSDLKPLNKALFDSRYFPDVASFVNENFVDAEYRLLTRGEVKNVIFSRTDKVVFKTDQSSKGKGVYVIRESEFDVEEMSTLGNGIFQSYIDQADDLAEFSNSGVSTLRVTTAIGTDRSPGVRASYLRLARSEDTHVQSETAIRIPVDLESGQLDELGYHPNFTTTPDHPDSGKTFSGFYYPKYDEVCRIALELHQKVPFVQSIGWDFCVDRSGQVNVMEWNGGYNDIKFSEATQGPCFKDLGWEKFAPRKTRRK